VYDADGKPLLSWRVLILPYLGQESLFHQFHLNEPWDSPHNRSLSAQIPNVYKCPSDPEASGLTTYEVLVDPRSLFTGKPEGVERSSVTDGNAVTFLVVEASTAVPWSKPEELSSLNGVGSRHPGGFNAAMADGSIHFIRNANPAEWKAFFTRDGGERVNPP
jgi:prepilin-type processing-associated H-X9-DG protein